MLAVDVISFRLGATGSLLDSHVQIFVEPRTTIAAMLDLDVCHPVMFLSMLTNSQRNYRPVRVARRCLYQGTRSNCSYRPSSCGLIRTFVDEQIYSNIALIYKSCVEASESAQLRSYLTQTVEEVLINPISSFKPRQYNASRPLHQLRMRLCFIRVFFI